MTSLRLAPVICCSLGLLGAAVHGQLPTAEKNPEKNIVRERDAVARFDQGRKWAVVVGVNEYLGTGIAPLTYCTADAKLVAKQLVERCGYEAERVLLLTDDQPKAHLRPLRINLDQQLRGWLSHATAGDTVLVFFSGHGFLDKQGQGFLAPQDCQKENLGLTALRTDELRDLLQQCAATQKVLILDCCHSGSEKGAAEGPSSQELGRSFQGAEGLVTLASCRKQQTSLEWKEKQQGLFTYYLSEGLGGAADLNRDGVVNNLELYTYVADKVPTTAQRELNGLQQPVQIIGEDVVGVFPLARVAAATLPIVPSPAVASFTPSMPRPLPTAPAPTPSSPGRPGEPLTNSLGMKLKLIPAGEFQMGSAAGDSDASADAHPQHRVRITEPYYLGIHEVTQGQWQAVMGTSPWSGKDYVKEGADYPATYVSWEDATEFCRKLSAREGKTYRLPTEAEWEYACRAGTSTKYSFGDVESQLGDYAWYDKNAFNVDEPYAHRVGQKQANPWGLYDMHGNVWEWCNDWYAEAYYQQSRIDDPAGLVEGSLRVYRGGCWYFTPASCRSANRSWFTPVNRSSNLGFRVALVP